LFRVGLLKKLTILLLLLTVLSGGAWLLLKYSPASLSFLQTKAPAPQIQVAKASPSEYLQWRDSLDQMDLLIRTEQDPLLLKTHKERQRYFWNKLQSVRNTLVTVDSTQTNKATTSPTDDGLVKFLSKVLTATALILLALILLLLMLLRRKKVALTKHLDALKEDQRFQGNRSGEVNDDSTPRAPIRRAPRVAAAYAASPNRMPETSSLDLSPNEPAMPDAMESRAGAALRPTARQRVTHALRGLAEALNALKSETGDGTPNPTTQDPTRGDATRAKVRSQNGRSTQASQVLAPTRYEREREENAEIVKLSRRGFTPSEIARRLRVPQDQVETVVRMSRDQV